MLEENHMIHKIHVILSVLTRLFSWVFEHFSWTFLRRELCKIILII